MAPTIIPRYWSHLCLLAALCIHKLNVEVTVLLLCHSVSLLHSGTPFSACGPSLNSLWALEIRVNILKHNFIDWKFPKGSFQPLVSAKITGTWFKGDLWGKIEVVPSRAGTALVAKWDWLPNDVLEFPVWLFFSFFFLNENRLYCCFSNYMIWSSFALQKLSTSPWSSPSPS